ncbi:hypothetical protein [Robertkochia flava]|uniref:hypothetical protein n=1 Tax=Robertkochia flava TaxID=3447986 RepID=UPI001CCB4A6E|nr:hypothetical protein [Robertkochia marina]
MRKLIFTLSALLLFIFQGFSQTGEGLDNYDWFQAKYVKFKPGKVNEARALLHDFLYKANEISGRLVLTFESDSGPWDHIAYLHLQDGPDQLENENAEIETRWWNGVIQLAGSEEKARELLKAYQECIDNEMHTLVRMRHLEEQISRRK